MAIVEMKRMSLLAPKQDERRLLQSLQNLGCVQITKEDSEDVFKPALDNQDLSVYDERMNRVHWAIGKIGRYDKTKAPLLGGKPVITTEEAHDILDTKQASLLQVVDRLEELEHENGELRGQLARILASREQLLPWQNLDSPVSDFHQSKHVMATLATVRKEGLDALLASKTLSPLCLVEMISNERDIAYVTVIVHQSVMEDSLAQLREIGYTPVHLNANATPSEQMAKLSKEENAIFARQAEIEKEISTFGPKTPELKLLFDCLASTREQLVVKQDTLTSKSTFYLRGWVPETMSKQVQSALVKISPSLSISFDDPEEGETPPVCLHNNKITSPYESIVSGFSLPSYSGFDPTAIMMPFFINFMGMMVSDAGYGLLMALLIPILIKFLKPAPGVKRLMWILTGGGIMTLVWGALYNTWFGFAPLPSLFDPVNNPMPVMGVCVALGAVHLFTGLGIAAYLNLRKGKVVDAIADQLSWAMLIIGLGLLVVLPDVGTWVALGGVAIILCTSGRQQTNNPLKRLMSGLGALYGATGWISDLLSYMRLFGMGLATGVIGMVINQLVAMVAGIPVAGYVLGPLLFVGGHLFNAGINILGAYVHSCRLQYIEFFGKFYEDGGQPFKPLSTSNRYCFITNTNNNGR